MQRNAKALIVVPENNTTMEPEIAALCPELAPIPVARVKRPARTLLLEDLPAYPPATRVAETRTAPRYLLYSAGDRYPALQPCPPGAGPGAAIAGEVYDLPLDVLRDELLPAEPPELELGVIELADG